MDSAKNVLRSIGLAMQQVRNATVQCSTVRGVRKVRHHSPIWLESEFQIIANASGAVLKVPDSAIEDQRKEIAGMSSHFLVLQAGLTNDIACPAQKLKNVIETTQLIGLLREPSKNLIDMSADACMWLLATDAYKSWREGKAHFCGERCSLRCSEGFCRRNNSDTAGAGKSVLAYVYTSY